MTAIDAAVGQIDPHHLGHDRESSYHQHTEGHAGSGLVSKRIVVGYGFWIFLLSDIVMFSAFFATYAVLIGDTAGGPSRPRTCSTCPTSLSRRRSCCLELHLRHRQHRRADAHSAIWFYGAMAATFMLGAAFLAIELHEFAEHDRAWGRPNAERVPLGVLYAGRLPRPSCHRRPAVAADDDGAGVRQRVTGRTFCGACSASACSGTPWTSFGLRYSPWCT